MDTFSLVSKELSVPLAENKTEGPTTKKYCSWFGNRYCVNESKNS
jgi:hypothetical protein